VLKTVRRSPLARQIQVAFAIASFGLLAFLQLPSKAQEKKSERSFQEQSAQRDQAYVRQLLEKDPVELCEPVLPVEILVGEAGDAEGEVPPGPRWRWSGGFQEKRS